MKSSERVILLLLMVLWMTAGGMAALGAYAALDNSLGEFHGGQASTEVEVKRVRVRAPLITQLSRDQAVRPGTEFILDARVEVMDGDPLTKTEWRVSKDGGKSYSGVIGNSLLFRTSQELNTPPHLPYYYKLQVENAGGVDEIVVQVLVTENPDEYSIKTLTDPATSVSVTGLIHERTQRLLIILKDVKEYPELMSLVAKDYVPLISYEVSIVNEIGIQLPYIGILELELPVGKVFESDQLRVFHRKPDNVIETLYGDVEDRKLKVVTSSLSPFLVEAPRSKTHLIQVETDPNGLVVPSGAVYVADGERQIFEFKPKQNFKLQKISVDGKETPVLGDRYVLWDVKADHTIRADFYKDYMPDGDGDRNEYTRGRSGNEDDGEGSGNGNTGGGSINGNAEEDDINGNIEEESVNRNTVWGSGNASRSTVVGSRNENTGEESSLNEVQDQWLKNKTVQKKYYKITVNSHGKGKISPSKTVTVKQGGSITFYFYPEEGYELGDLLVNGKNVEVYSGTYRLEEVSEDMEVIVSYRKAAAGGRRCRCPLCTWWGISFWPWCWLIPLLLLMRLLLALWRKWAGKKKKNQEDEAAVCQNDHKNE